MIEAVQARVGAALRREVPVGLALTLAALLAPLLTLAALTLVALPLTAIDVRRGWWRAARRLPEAARVAWRGAATTAGATVAAALAVVGLLWWSPATDEPFARWSPAEAAEHAGRTAAVVTAPVVGVAALRRTRPA